MLKEVDSELTGTVIFILLLTLTLSLMLTLVLTLALTLTLTLTPTLMLLQQETLLQGILSRQMRPSQSILVN